MTAIGTQIPLPPKVPRKRKQIEQTLDVHIATWLASDDITPSERRLLQAEKERRKKIRKTHNYVVAVIVAPEGATPEQNETLKEHIDDASEIRHNGRLPKNTHATCVRAANVTQYHGEAIGCSQAAIRYADKVVALVKSDRPEPYASGGTWGLIGHARQRDKPVTIIKPNGETINLEDS